MIWKTRFCIGLTALTLLVSSGFTASQTAPGGSDAAGIERAISLVYPALVQIHVVVADYGTGRAQKYEAAGSGVIISPDGYVVTNHHVAGRAAAIRCVLTSRQELDATLIGTDVLTDIAVLKLDLSSFPDLQGKLAYAKFGSTDLLKIGDVIFAMGCPLALSQSVTKGIVANKEMMLSRRFTGSMILDGEDVGLLVKWIAHDAQILPGNSGGPLVNTQGLIVGINEINVGGGSGGGLGGAIPSELAQTVAQELIEKGRVARSWIGVEFQPLLKGSTIRNGVLVSGVIPDSPAQKSGLKAGDIVDSIDGKPVHVEFREELPPLNRIILSRPVGSTLQIKYLRQGKEATASVTTRLREEAAPKEGEAQQWGLVVQNLTNLASKEMHLGDTKGVVISSVRSGGPADQGTPPLQAGDIILSIANEPIVDRDSFFRITSQITRDKTASVATLVSIRRNAESVLSVVEVGIRTPQSPTPEARKAWLPVETQVLSPKLAAALGVQGKKGVRITNVFSELTPSGFQAGDIVTHIDGLQVEASEPQDTTVFEAMLRAYRIGSKPQFTVIRDGKTLEISQVLTEQPKPDREMLVYQNVPLEFRARDVSYDDRTDHSLDPADAGAIVTQVERGGWAGIGGLMEGDLIKEVNHHPVRSATDLQQLLGGAYDQRSKFVVLLVKRGIHTQFLELQPVWQEGTAR
jgi:serine protease Do